MAGRHILGLLEFVATSTGGSPVVLDISFSQLDFCFEPVINSSPLMLDLMPVSNVFATLKTRKSVASYL